MRPNLQIMPMCESLGKGEVVSSILPGSTVNPQDFRRFQQGITIMVTPSFGRTKQRHAACGTRWRARIRAAVAGAFSRPSDLHLMRHQIQNGGFLPFMAVRFPTWMIVDRRLSVAGGGE